MRTTKNSPLATEQLRQRAVAAAKAATAAEVVIAIPVASVCEVPQRPTRTEFDDTPLHRQMLLVEFEQDRLDEEAEVLGLVTDHSDFMSDRAVDDIHSTIIHEITINEPRFWFV